MPAITTDLHSAPFPPTSTHPILTQLYQRYSGILSHYSNTELLKHARSLIPVNELLASLSPSTEPPQIKSVTQFQSPLPPRLEFLPKGIEPAEFLEQFVLWFKKKFFSWVDKPGCQFCGVQKYLNSASIDLKIE